VTRRTTSEGIPSGVPSLVASGVTAAIGFGLARLAYDALRRRPPGGRQRWSRVNHRGEPVTLLEGPALAFAAAGALLLGPGVPARLRVAAGAAAIGAGAFGVLDDLADRGGSKGLRGHLGALRRGELTTGGVKILGIGATGLVAAAVAGPGGTCDGRFRRAIDVASSGALVAGSANLLNLFDLRPGRALKVGLLAAPAVLAAGPASAVVASAVGPSVALLGEDLGERAMLGDGGANALGAVLGTALVAGAGRRTRLAALATVVGLTLASEKVSFTKVIGSTPVLRELDALGRRPPTTLPHVVPNAAPSPPSP
jgi:UDP-N-acetylmuramyl pentapeptide phosphotransferase/UDP-N-acetylglucosamine-1-phosphate transferase